jgi:hypothetical protein
VCGTLVQATLPGSLGGRQFHRSPGRANREARPIEPLFIPDFQTCTHPLRSEKPGYVYFTSKLLEARRETASETSRFTFGPDVQVRLGHHLAADINLLYKRAEFGFQSARISTKALCGRPPSL